MTHIVDVKISGLSSFRAKRGRRPSPLISLQRARVLGRQKRRKNFDYHDYDYSMIKSDTFFYALKYAVKWPNFFFNLFALKNDPIFFQTFCPKKCTNKWTYFVFNLFALKKDLIFFNIFFKKQWLKNWSYFFFHFFCSKILS